MRTRSTDWDLASVVAEYEEQAHHNFIRARAAADDVVWDSRPEDEMEVSILAAKLESSARELISAGLETIKIAEAIRAHVKTSRSVT